MPPRAPILVVGGTGLLGRHLVSWASGVFGSAIATHLNTAPDDLDLDGVEWFRCNILDERAVEYLVDAMRPTSVVNAAYVQTGPNAAAVCNDGAFTVARAAQRVGARLIHVSTDLVFDGTLGRRYVETDAVSPVNAYGRAKADAEARICALDMHSLVVRTSLIYGEPWAPQERLVSRALSGEDISFFTDEYRTPVDVRSLARTVGALVPSDETGIVHIAGDSRLNRFEFARYLALELGEDPDLLHGRASKPSDGVRPKDVSLDTSRAKALGFAIPGPMRHE